MLKNAQEEKQKEQQQQQQQQQQQNTGRRPSTPQKSGAASSTSTETKEVTLRDLVEKQDSAGVRKFLDGRPYMVGFVQLCYIYLTTRSTTVDLFSTCLF